MRQRSTLPTGYPEFLAEVKARVRVARTQAILAANQALVELYWEIGQDTLTRERREG